MRTRCQIAGRLAHHYRETGDLAQTAFYAAMAAEQALEVGAFPEAAAFYQQALQLAPEPGLRLGLGQALERQGDRSGAIAAFEQALHEFDSREWWREAARVCLALEDIQLAANDGQEVTVWAERALAYLDRHPEDELQAFAHILLGAGGMRSGGTLADAEAHLRLAARLTTQPHLVMRSSFELGNVLLLRGEHANARALYAQVITLAQAAAMLFQEVLASNNAAHAALLVGDLQAARQDIERGLTLVESNGMDIPFQWLLSTRGELALAEQQWDEAETWLRRGLAEAQRHSNHSQIVSYQMHFGLLARGRGDLARP